MCWCVRACGTVHAGRVCWYDVPGAGKGKCRSGTLKGIGPRGEPEAPGGQCVSRPASGVSGDVSDSEWERLHAGWVHAAVVKTRDGMEGYGWATSRRFRAAWALLVQLPMCLGACPNVRVRLRVGCTRWSRGREMGWKVVVGNEPAAWVGPGILAVSADASDALGPRVDVRCASDDGECIGKFSENHRALAPRRTSTQAHVTSGDRGVSTPAGPACGQGNPRVVPPAQAVLATDPVASTRGAGRTTAGHRTRGTAMPSRPSV